VFWLTIFIGDTHLLFLSEFLFCLAVGCVLIIIDIIY
jgi:hypothetical protein